MLRRRALGDYFGSAFPQQPPLPTFRDTSVKTAPKLHYEINLQVSSWHKRWDTEVLRWQPLYQHIFVCNWKEKVAASST